MPADGLTGGTVRPPRVSVVMSVCNGAAHMDEALAGIFNQTFPDFELIVVDDGSTDATPRILAQAAARDPRMRLLTLAENIGLTRALNRGLALARTGLIAHHNADDISEPQRLEKQIALLDTQPSIVLLGTACREIDAAGAVRSGWTPPDTDTAIRWQMLFHNAFIHSSVMARRSAIEAAGGSYDERLPYSQDMEFWGRVLRHGLGANLPQPLVCFRRHPASVSSTRPEEQQRIATQIALDRMRELAPELSMDETGARILRECFAGIPAGADRALLRSCRLYFDLLEALARRSGSDAAEIVQIRRQTVKRLARSASPGALLASGLAFALLRQSPGVCLVQMLKRLCGSRPAVSHTERPA